MYGIDVSHYQNPDPEHIPYAKCDFVIVKASEGVTVDSAASKHVKNVRDAKKVLGLYHFYRRDQDFAAQAQCFLNAAKALGYQVGDIIPALDIEEHRGLLPNNGWNHPAEAIAKSFEENFGGCLIYINLRDYHLLGSPEWIRERKLWLAEWSKDYRPPEKDSNVAIWQHRVAPFEYDGEAGAANTYVKIDQNRMLAKLEDLQMQGEDEEDDTTEDEPEDPSNKKA